MLIQYCSILEKIALILTEISSARAHRTLLQQKISERMTKIYRMGSNSFSHSSTKHVKNAVFQSVLKRQILTDFIQKELATFAKL